MLSSTPSFNYGSFQAGRLYDLSSKPMLHRNSSPASGKASSSSPVQMTPSEASGSSKGSDSTLTSPQGPHVSPTLRSKDSAVGPLVESSGASKHEEAPKASRSNPSSGSSHKGRSSGPASQQEAEAAKGQDPARKSLSRRPKMLRLTPAFSSAPGALPGKGKDSISFPGGDVGNTTTATPLHITSRKALAMKASAPSDAPPGLQLDLACLPVPSIMDKMNPASTSTLPDLVRKKSGAPVKSSLKHFPASAFPSRADSLQSSLSSRAKSVPTTPTLPKAVHFDRDLEQVKVFKHRQRPSAVSRDGSPEQTETETEEERDFPFLGMSKSSEVPPKPQVDNSIISPREGEEQLVLRLPNFPSSTKMSVERDVFLERVCLADDLRSVKGTIQVRNISFEKWVAVRFTLDNWVTVNEVSAEFSESVKDGAADRFTFSIKLNELLNWPRGAGQQETKSMFVCIRFRTIDKELWDNNEGQNYQLDFRKRPVPVAVATKPRVERSTAQSHSTARSTQFADHGRVLVNSMHRPAGHQMMEELKKELSKLKSDADSNPDRCAAQDTSRAKSPPSSPSQRSNSPSMWSARYDFGHSLKNPASGSRKSDGARTAALDYFSSRHAKSSSADSPQPSPLAPLAAAPDGRVPAADMTVAYEAAQMWSSQPPTISPSLTPASLTPTRFNTFPLSRSPLNNSSPGFTADLPPRTPSPPQGASPVHTAGKAGSIYDDYGSELASPISPMPSPSGFSPSTSTTSLDSENIMDNQDKSDSRRSDVEEPRSNGYRPDSTTSLQDLLERFCWGASDGLPHIAEAHSSLQTAEASGPPTPRVAH